MLQPLDVLVVLKLSVRPGTAASYSLLASSIGVSTSQAHSAVKRAQASRLVSRSLEIRQWSTYHMLAFGVPYFIPAEEGAETRGIPTSYGIEPLSSLFGNLDRVPVWPLAGGVARGPSIEPIYKTVPLAAQNDEELHQLLALVDAVRAGRARERNAAREKMAKIFGVEE